MAQRRFLIQGNNMKITRFLALTVAFAPMTVMAGPLDELLGAALKAATADAQAQTQGGAIYGADRHGNQRPRDESRAQRIDDWTRGRINDWDFSKGGTVEAFCARVRSQQGDPDNLPYLQDCEARFGGEFNAAQQNYKSGVEQQAKAQQEANSRRAAAQQEEDRRVALEKQKAAAHEADLRGGRIKPQNFGEVAIAHGAKHGGDLASAPKIKPDGGMYYLNGKIKMAGEEPQFLAALSSSKENELLAGALRRSRGMGESTDYFAVTIPKSLQKYYFDNAKIDGGFDVVGRYVSNTKYKTVAGQEKAAPVFEAVYFVIW